MLSFYLAILPAPPGPVSSKLLVSTLALFFIVADALLAFVLIIMVPLYRFCNMVANW